MPITAQPRFTDEHRLFRESVAAFAAREITPYAERWEADPPFSRQLFAQAGTLGYLGVRADPAFGGGGLDHWYTVVLCEELARSGSLGTAIGLLAHSEFALAAIDAYGSAEQKEQFLRPAIAGERIACIGLTEPAVGSDLTRLRTVARRDGADYVISGQKTFITNGTRADFVTLAVRTGEQGPRGVSLILFPTDTEGFRVGRSLAKVGMHASDTAELYFDECRVPAHNLLGEEGAGMRYIVEGFAAERLVLSCFAHTVMERLYETATAYAREREVSGKRLAEHQVWRHRLADFRTAIESARQLTYWACELIASGDPGAHEAVSMAKLHSCEQVRRLALEAVQIHGGYGYLEEYPVARMYREVGAFTIGAGSSEVMREIVAREERL